MASINASPDVSLTASRSSEANARNAFRTTVRHSQGSFRSAGLFYSCSHASISTERMRSKRARHKTRSQRCR